MTLLDVFVSVGCLYYFTILLSHQLSSKLEKMVQRNQRGTSVAILSSFLTYTILGIAEFTVSDYSYFYFFVMFTSVDTCTNALSLYWINAPVLRRHLWKESIDPPKDQVESPSIHPVSVETKTSDEQ